MATRAAPYIYNGAAANLSELLEFHNERSQIHRTPHQTSGLIAFLNAL